MDIKKLIDNVPIKNRLFILNQLTMIDLAVKTGLKEDSAWGDEDQALLEKITTCARELTENQLKLIKTI